LLCSFIWHNIAARRPAARQWISNAYVVKQKTTASKQKNAVSYTGLRSRICYCSLKPGIVWISRRRGTSFAGRCYQATSEDVSVDTSVYALMKWKAKSLYKSPTNSNNKSFYLMAISNTFCRPPFATIFVV
jgi:hypothetical protein